MKGLFALTVALVLVAPDPPDVRILFSPKGGCAEAVVERIQHATTEIKVQEYQFSLKDVSDALINAHRRGVAVDIILDKRQQVSDSSRWKDCEAAGITVNFDYNHPIAHNKIIIVDRYIVIGGSWNPSKQAEKNAENMTITRSRDVAKIYLANWAAHREHARKTVSQKK